MCGLWAAGGRTKRQDRLLSGRCAARPPPVSHGTRSVSSAKRFVEPALHVGRDRLGGLHPEPAVILRGRSGRRRDGRRRRYDRGRSRLEHVPGRGCMVLRRAATTLGGEISRLSSTFKSIWLRASKRRGGKVALG